MFSLLRLALCFVVSNVCFATVWYVPDNFPTPQSALDNCQSQDTVVLRSGEYLGPITLPLQSITLASEYIFVPNPLHIENCVIRPDTLASVRRCLDTDEIAVENIDLKIVGLTVADARVFGDETNGGGIRIRYRNAHISNCVFSSCFATNGGALFVDESDLSASETLFILNDASSLGRVMFARNAICSFNGCTFGPSGYLQAPPSTESEFVIEDSELGFNGCRFHGLGASVEGRTTAISLIDRSVCDSITFRNCLIEDNEFQRFISSGNRSGMRNFILDSCQFTNNIIAFGLFGDFEHDSLRRSEVTNCVFENTHRPSPAFGGPGLLDFSDSNKTFVLAENRFGFNDGGAFSCLHISDLNAPLTARVRRNFFYGNSNHNVTSPPGGAVYTSNTSSGILERNSFDGNIGHAVDTWEFGQISYAKLNWWGDASGPYEQVRNSLGLGDTTDEHTVYDQWLHSEEEIYDSTLTRIGNEPPLSIPMSIQLTAAYPNPFNGRVTIEFVLLKDQDITLDVYDLTGRHVETILNDRMRKGVHIRDWSPESQASGIYFARLVGADGVRSTTKLMYLK